MFAWTYAISLPLLAASAGVDTGGSARIKNRRRPPSPLLPKSSGRDTGGPFPRAPQQGGRCRRPEVAVLADGTPVRVAITPLDEDYDPLEGVIGIGESGRADGAEQHDHYIYGTPKR